MKRCPECRKDYLDDSLLYCLDDGTPLVQGSVSDEPATAILSGLGVSPFGGTSAEDATGTLKAGDTADQKGRRTSRLSERFSRERLPWIVAGMFGLIAVAALSYIFLLRSSANEKAVRLSFEPPAELSFNDIQPDSAVISPDGTKVAFSAAANGKTGRGRSSLTRAVFVCRNCRAHCLRWNSMVMCARTAWVSISQSSQLR